MRDIGINRIMTIDPATVGPDEPIAAARARLEAARIHHLPVVENRKLAGILSTADLLKLFFLDDGAASLDDLTVGQFMETDPVALGPDATLRDIAIKLSLGGYHALPVIEPDGELLGIVTSGDLIDYLLKQIDRGDGSMQTGPRPAPTSRISGEEVAELVSEADRAVDEGRELDRLALALLYYRDRNRKLGKACHAAELYMRSGQGEREHSALVRNLAHLQKSGKRLDL